MKQKNIIIFGIILLVLISIFIVSYVQNKNEQKNFIYKTGSIPQDKLISTDNFGNIDTTQIKGGPCTGSVCVSSIYVCKDTNKNAEKIEFYSNSVEPNIEGGWSYRYALVCGNNYWILDTADSFGTKIYGPFRK